jgi:uncharacterized protein YxeA
MKKVIISLCVILVFIFVCFYKFSNFNGIKKSEISEIKFIYVQGERQDSWCTISDSYDIKDFVKNINSSKASFNDKEIKSNFIARIKYKTGETQDISMFLGLQHGKLVSNGKVKHSYKISDNYFKRLMTKYVRLM